MPETKRNVTTGSEGMTDPEDRGFDIPGHPLYDRRWQDYDWEHVWTEPGPRGMQLKSHENFVPQKYIRRWHESNEERLLRALKSLKSLKLRVKFEIEESGEDVARRRGVLPDDKFKKQFHALKGKTIQIRKIPTIGMLWQIVKAMQDAAVEAAKK